MNKNTTNFLLYKYPERKTMMSSNIKLAESNKLILEAISSLCMSILFLIYSSVILTDLRDLNKNTSTNINNLNIIFFSGYILKNILLILSLLEHATKIMKELDIIDKFNNEYSYSMNDDEIKDAIKSYEKSIKSLKLNNKIHLVLDGTTIVALTILAFFFAVSLNYLKHDKNLNNDNSSMIIKTLGMSTMFIIYFAELFYKNKIAAKSINRSIERYEDDIHKLKNELGLDDNSNSINQISRFTP